MALGPCLETLFAEIGIDKNYEDMDFSGLSFDSQGWGHEHEILKIAIADIRPQLVVEVGSWKGASVLEMFNASRKLGLPTRFICVDTWLGSHVDLWYNLEYRRDLMLRGGFPSMFRQFLFNMIEKGAIGSVFPLPMTSTAAAAVIRKMGLIPDLVYIDAGHDEDDVACDIRRYFDILRPGGMMIGDDYSVNWPGVISAVNRFAFQHSLLLRTDKEKWWFLKPASSSVLPSVLENLT